MSGHPEILDTATAAAVEGLPNGPENRLIRSLSLLNSVVLLRLDESKDRRLTVSASLSGTFGGLGFVQRGGICERSATVDVTCCGHFGVPGSCIILVKKVSMSQQTYRQNCCVYGLAMKPAGDLVTWVVSGWNCPWNQDQDMNLPHVYLD
jgi:hypothetical protein